LKRDWKAEAVKQWDADPCGASRSFEFGTPEFFERVERERYVEYAPWMKTAIGFDRHSGKRVLEVGFGLGTDYVSFARGGARIFGIDLTPTHVDATRRRLREIRYPVRLTRGDAETLPFRDGSFDVVYSFGVLHHTPGTQVAIGEIYRVLRPGGEAIVGLYHRDSAVFWGYYVLIWGLLRGRFLREGYRATLSRIERREHSDAMPLVQVYSRGNVRRMFSRFRELSIQTHHFSFDQIGRAGRLAKRFFARFEPFLERTFGWYLIVKARKPIVPLSVESGELHRDGD
jgi:SAM-dependent methyltransferase